MYGNGAGTGKQTVTMKKQKVEATQPVPRRALTASFAVVVGTTVRAAVLFLGVVTAATLTTATAAMVSVLCVPVLNKI